MRTDGPDPLVLRTVAERWGLPARFACRRLSGGFANDVYRLDLPTPLVLQVRRPPIDADDLRWEQDLTRVVARSIAQVPAPVPTADGAGFVLHGGAALVVTPFLRGAPARPGDRTAVAGVLARLHQVRAPDGPAPARPRLRDLPFPPLRAMPASFAPWSELLRNARNEVIEVVEGLRSRDLVEGVAHGDVFAGNVLVDHGRVTGLIDWEEANVEWLHWDLAVALWPFCSTGPVLDRAAMRDFLGSYRDAGGPADVDDEDLVVELVRVKRILEVLRAPTDRDPRWPLQLTNLRAYRALG